jgi:uncharacterized membrane protein YphA (DoxX/SURF4 family)
MKGKLPLIARLLLGLVFCFGGITGLLNLFMNLFPMPPDLPEQLQVFNKGLAASGYFMPLLKLTETICGLFLLTGFYVPLALVILAPIVLNIFLTHLFLAPGGVPLAAIIGLLLVYLAFFAKPYSQPIRNLFRAK